MGGLDVTVSVIKDETTSVTKCMPSRSTIQRKQLEPREGSRWRAAVQMGNIDEASMKSVGLEAAGYSQKDTGR